MMINSQQLGRLERVPLRDFWDREDTSFTPWLAREENISLLAQAIGMELEVMGQEVRVGPFRADILSRTPDGGHQVLIENQLEATDHSHLGQLMTYAAGLDAVSIVWIAGRFTDEHRAALDWLNRITVEGVNFFGLEVELWRIGDSMAAPKFNVISQPNEWAKMASDVGRRGPDSLTPGQQLQLDFWTEFNQFIASTETTFRPVKPQPQNWLCYGMGASLFTLEGVVNLREGWVGVRLSFPIAYLPLVAEDRDAIHMEIGSDLAWSEARTVGVLLLSRPADLGEHSNWLELQQWMLHYMERFASAFRKRAAGYKQNFKESSD